MDPLLPKVSQIFEYLLAVKNVKEKPIRSINQYEEVWWQNELPYFNGCHLYGNGTNTEAWLEVHKQEIPPTPSLPQILSQWVKKWDNPDNEPTFEAVIKIKVKAESGGQEIEVEKDVFFEEDPKRVEVYNEWLRAEWRTWAAEASPKKKIQALYMKLFSLHQRFQREGDDVELVWGHGLLSWNIQSEKILRPLLTTRLELQFDAKKGIFYLLPTSKGTAMETDMLNNIEVPNIQRIQEMGRQINDAEIDPRDEESIGTLLKEIVHTISPEGKYSSQDSLIEEKGKGPIVIYSPLLLLRKSGSRIWQNELSAVLEILKDGYPVPETIKILTTDDEITTSTKEGTESDSTWKSVGDELLFPLSSNFEQKLIAQKLASNSGVVVQGPPGTGKSHTIVNLISHLLAHGKRVLVTSEKERALQVLRDKIPKEIRALCASLLGGDSKSMKELEDSIKHIAENLDRLQPEILEKNIERKHKELHETRKNIAKLQHDINSAAELENQSISVDGQEMTPMEIGKWLHDHITYNSLPDEIPWGTDIPFSMDKLKKYFHLLGSLSSIDIEQLETVRPKTTDIPSPSQFQEKVNQITQLKNEVKDRSEHVKGWTIPESYYDLDNLVSRLKVVIQELDKLQDPWCQNLFAEVLKSEKRIQEWDQFVKECKERLAKLEQLEKELIETVIDFPESINQTMAKEDLIELRVKLEDKKTIGWFFKNVLGRKYAYLLDGLKIDGLQIRSASDIDVLLKYVEINDIKSKLSIKWNRTMEDINGVTIEPKMSRYRNHVEDHLNKIQSIVFWKSGVIESLHEMIQTLGVPQPYNWIEKSWYEQILLGINSIEAMKKFDVAKEFIRDTETILSSGLNINNAHCSWKELLNACIHMDVDSWTKSYLDVKRLEELEDDYNAFCTYTNKLSAIAPNWVNQLFQQGRKGEEVKLPPDLREAWKWSQLNHWMNNHLEITNIEPKEQLLEIERKTEARIIKELVVNSTWLSQIQRTTKPQKTSLHAWLNAIKRIGKGTGTHANMYRKEASEEMKTCRGAIPVWIMPIQKVIENIQLNGDIFDVVIVDESSQSDLFSLSALLRAKKVVIVGDDNQISPESVGQDIGEVKQLIDRYLTGIPHRNRFEMKTSLYDMASQVFDSKIILKEHFRCVPEIIQFSNDLMYGGQMDPLRLPLGHEKMEPPIKTIHVAEGYRSENTTKTLNIPEAEALVQHIAECCQDPQYEGKTLGVISLQGHDQAKLIEELLREALGEEEMINRKLVCGDSYSFQGDERDVMFLSMVAANNARIGPLAKRTDMQRFNVAASRARDQMVLFHSAELRDLNPVCIRYSLLQYCKDPKRVQMQLDQVEHEFDSQFEKDVFTLIAARGYRVIPQVKVGTLGKKIDLVVEGIRGRLAVECDGDKWHGLDQWEADMERQRILERVGWTFWRVRGSAFYRDPAKAMEPLWRKLNELQIIPQITESKEQLVVPSDYQDEVFSVDLGLKKESIGQNINPYTPQKLRLSKESGQSKQKELQITLEDLSN